jgi:hypothetical protein
MRAIVLIGCAAGLTLAPLAAEAQQPTRRRQQTIEIRGQVPTPQVVTVRPREVPAYSRQVISPNFYDRNFWPSILPGYQLVTQRMLTGRPAGDTTGRGATRAAPGAASDTTGGASGMTVRPPTGTTPANLRTTPAGASSGTGTAGDTTRTVPPDTTGGAGTPPAPGRR